MSALGQKQTYAVQQSMSALPPKADITREDASLEKKVAHVSWLPS